MQASVCVGNYAAIPYNVAGLEIPVYSMEELCYCIKEHAFLLDMSLMNDELLLWIEKECGLQELSAELHPLVHKQGSLSAFVTLILEYTGFFDRTVTYDVQQVLKQGAGLSIIEKKKSQLDYLVQKKKYMPALHGYDKLLRKWQETGAEAGEENLPAADVRAAIIYNKGVVFTRLMLYDQAAECFWDAYQQSGNDEYFMAYLAAKRMMLSESEYIDFAAGVPDSYSYSLTLEKQMEELQNIWTERAEYKRLKQREEWRTGGESQKYYEENDRITQALKNSYRSSVAD